MSKTHVFTYSNLRTSVIFTTFLSVFCACGGDPKSTMAGDDNDFRVSDTSDVTRIFMADRDGSTIKLDRISKTEWKLNDKYRTRKAIIDGLLTTLADIRVRYAINESARPLVERELATKGIKVEVYEGSHKKTFYVGGPTPDQMGTNMLMEGAKRIYVTHIEGWEGVLTTRFCTEEAQVRDHSFLDVSNLAEISVEYPSKKEHSFRVLTQGTAHVEPFYVSTPATAKPLQARILRSYLDNIGQVRAADFINDSPIKDSTIQTVPFCKITLRNTRNELQNLSIFHTRPVPSEEGGSAPVASSERFFCWYNDSKGNKDFMLTQSTTMKNLMWSYESFYTEIPTAAQNGSKKPREQRYK
jgi:hypothetical protein